MPFDPSDNDAWWPNPWPPRMGPGGGSPSPYDWTGNAFSDRGTSHFSIHELLEQEFWNRYRQGGSLFGSMPTNGEYGQFGRLSLIAGGFPSPQASDLALQAAAQRAAKGLSETDPVPRIPGPLNQK
jgi:hypothetical protein